MDLSDAFARFPYAELAGTTGNARLRLCTVAYEFPRDTSEDGDWHVGVLELVAGPFRAVLREPMYQGQELLSLWRGLGELHTGNAIEARYDPLEPYLKFRVKLDPCGAWIVKGRVTEETTTANKLRFEFATDMSAVVRFREGLAGILERFPLRGIE